MGNKKYLIDFLNEIEQLIVDGYEYITFIRLMYKYIQLFSYGFKYNELDCEDYSYRDFINTANESPFIIYPSLVQVDYNKVIYFMQAPVLNFRLTNARLKIHNIFQPPSYELLHDVRGHGSLTHGWRNHRLRIVKPRNNTVKLRYNTVKQRNNTKLYRGIENVNKTILHKPPQPAPTYKNEFQAMHSLFGKYQSANNTIQLLKPLLQYNIHKAEDDITQIDMRNLMYTIILFTLLHELVEHNRNIAGIIQLEDIGTLQKFLKTNLIDDNMDARFHIMQLKDEIEYLKKYIRIPLYTKTYKYIYATPPKNSSENGYNFTKNYNNIESTMIASALSLYQTLDELRSKSLFNSLKNKYKSLQLKFFS